jgi:hypothetical protein
MTRVYAMVILATLTVFFVDVAPFGCCGSKPPQQDQSVQLPH